MNIKNITIIDFFDIGFEEMKAKNKDGKVYKYHRNDFSFDGKMNSCAGYSKERFEREFEVECWFN